MNWEIELFLGLVFIDVLSCICVLVVIDWLGLVFVVGGWFINIFLFILNFVLLLVLLLLFVVVSSNVWVLGLLKMIFGLSDDVFENVGVWLFV